MAATKPRAWATNPRSKRGMAVSRASTAIAPATLPPLDAPWVRDRSPTQTDQVALAGVLDQRPFEDAANRAWVFRTVGSVHGHAFWAAFVATLREVGYDDALAIENEDASVTPQQGVEIGAAFMRPLLTG